MTDPTQAQAEGEELRAKLHAAANAYRKLDPVELALHADDQRRSFVRGQSGQDPGPGILAQEVRRLRDELSRRAPPAAAGSEEIERALRNHVHFNRASGSREIDYDGAVSAILAMIDLPMSGAPTREEVEVIKFFRGMANRWRGIACAMGYEPRAHKEVIPSEPWLVERIDKYRKQAALEYARPAAEGGLVEALLAEAKRERDFVGHAEANRDDWYATMPEAVSSEAIKRAELFEACVAALAAHARQGGGDEWQSLEVAPREEGSLIILRHDDHPEGLRVAQFKGEGNSGPGWYPARSECWVVRDRLPYRDGYLWAHVPAIASAQAGGGVGS